MHIWIKLETRMCYRSWEKRTALCLGESRKASRWRAVRMCQAVVAKVLILQSISVAQLWRPLVSPSSMASSPLSPGILSEAVGLWASPLPPFQCMSLHFSLVKTKRSLQRKRSELFGLSVVQFGAWRSHLGLWREGRVQSSGRYQRPEPTPCHWKWVGMKRSNWGWTEDFTLVFGTTANENSLATATWSVSYSDDIWARKIIALAFVKKGMWADRPCSLGKELCPGGPEAAREIQPTL